jgi:hypothetical protein
MPCSALPVHVPLAARADELLDHVRHIALRERPHLLRSKIANRVRQDYIRMSRHTFGAKLKYGGVGECLGDDDCGRDAALLECNRVVHTAQRTRASAPHRHHGHMHVARQRVDERRDRGFGVVVLAAQTDLGDPILLA